MSPSATHAPHPLTTLAKTPKDQTTLEFNGRLFKVRHLPSKAIDTTESKDIKRLSEQERKALLTGREKNTLNLAKRLLSLEPQKQAEVLARRVIDRKKHELRIKLGVGKVSRQLKKVHPDAFMATEAEVEQEAKDVLQFQRLFDTGFN